MLENTVPKYEIPEVICKETDKGDKALLLEGPYDPIDTQEPHIISIPFIGDPENINLRLILDPSNLLTIRVNSFLDGDEELCMYREGNCLEFKNYIFELYQHNDWYITQRVNSYVLRDKGDGFLGLIRGDEPTMDYLRQVKIKNPKVTPDLGNWFKENVVSGFRLSLDIEENKYKQQIIILN